MYCQWLSATNSLLIGVIKSSEEHIKYCHSDRREMENEQDESERDIYVI